MAPVSRGLRIHRTLQALAALVVLALLTPACGGNEGADLYAAECARCHGSDRGGLDGAGPDLGPTSFALEESDMWLAERINNGYHQMPRFTSTLSDGQIAVLVTYLRYGPDAPPGQATTSTTTFVPDDELLARGKVIFEREAGTEGEGCAGCHAVDARGSTEGPNILGTSKSGIAEALDGGVVEMGEIELTPEDLEAVYRYIGFLSEQR